MKLPRIRKNYKIIFLAALMVFSVFLSVSNMPADTPLPDNQPDYIGSWKGMKIYAQNTSANSSIYYVEIQPGYSIIMRADPREAEQVPGPDSLLIYANLYSSSRVFMVFDPKDEKEIGIAYAEMAKFLAGRPFDYVFATTEPYTDDANRTYPFRAPYNTSSEEAVIFMKISNETRVELVNRTVVVTGEDMWSLATAAAKVQLTMLRLM